MSLGVRRHADALQSLTLFFLGRKGSAFVIAVAGCAIIADAAFGAVAFDAGLDRREIQIAGEFAIHHLVAVHAGDTFLVQGVIEAA